MDRPILLGKYERMEPGFYWAEIATSLDAIILRSSGLCADSTSADTPAATPATTTAATSADVALFSKNRALP